MKKSSEKIIEFTIVYNRYKRRLLNYVLNLTGNKMHSEDILQNVFLKYFDNMDSLRDKSKSHIWLFKTARNEIYGYFRGKKSKADQFNTQNIDEIIEPFEEKDLYTEYELREIKEIIMKELSDMNIEQREPYLLKEYGGLTYREISSIIGIEEKTVKSRLYKVRQKLIKKISKIV